MARSHAIYVCQDEYDHVLAAFTVKHEMRTWATRNRRDLTNAGKRLRVLRYRDGAPQPGRSLYEVLTPKEVFGDE